MKKSFILYADCDAFLEELTDEQAGRLFRALFAYVNEEPFEEYIADPVIRMAFVVIKNQINRDSEKYAERCEKNRQIAIEREKRRRELRAQTNTNVHERVRTNTNITDNDNDSDNDNEVTKVTNKKEHSKECKKKDTANAATLTQNMEARKKAFYDSLVPYVNTYGKELVREFYDYWTECNRSKTKMRFEQQPTWETGKRLAYWAKRDNNYGTDNKPSNSSEQRAAEAAGIIARLAEEDDARQ